jgi:hypothetical protein
MTLVIALGAASCSDPVPPAARGGVTMTITPVSPAVAGRSCSTSGFTARIGDPSPTETSAEGRVTDGKEGADVECGVSGGDDGFEFDAQAFDESETGTVNFSASGTLSGTSGVGTVSINTDRTGRLASPPEMPCQFDVNGGNLQVDTGLIWARFSCDAAFDQSSPSTTYCQISGVMAFDNCRK